MAVRLGQQLRLGGMVLGAAWVITLGPALLEPFFWPELRSTDNVGAWIQGLTALEQIRPLLLGAATASVLAGRAMNSGDGTDSQYMVEALLLASSVLLVLLILAG